MAAVNPSAGDPAGPPAAAPAAAAAGPLALHCWRPPAGEAGSVAVRPWAVLGLVHGIGSHGGSFEALAEALTPAGLILVAVDLPGHGRSPRRRGDVRGWDELRAAVDLLLQRVDQEAPGLPCFLLGHSLGGAIVLDAAERRAQRLAGVVVSNPALAVEPSGPLRLRLLLARLLAGVSPGFTLATGITTAAAAHDPAVCARIAADPLRHDRCSAALAVAWQRRSSALMAAAPRFPLPLLVLQSSADGVISAAAVQHYVQRIREGALQQEGSRPPDVTLQLYDHSLHELLDDGERLVVIARLLAWLRAHTG
ncbi:MAG: alpha/beta fold hydrolase [Cyanobacteria bacterium J06638_7]